MWVQGGYGSVARWEPAASPVRWGDSVAARGEHGQVSPRTPHGRPSVPTDAPAEGKARGGGGTRRLPGGLRPGEAGRAGAGRAGRAGSIQTNRPPLCCPQLPFTKDNPGCISGFPFQLPGGGRPRAQRGMRPLPIGGPGYVAPTEWGEGAEQGHGESPSPGCCQGPGVREEGTGNPTAEPRAPLAGGGRSGKTPLLAGAQPTSPGLPPATSGAPLG